MECSGPRGRSTINAARVLGWIAALSVTFGAWGVKADDPEAHSTLDPISDFTSAILGEGSGREIWTGVDIASHTWLTFSGFTYAPFGGIFDDGLRVRMMGGYGGYDYARSSSRGKQTYAVKKSYADLLAGYQKRIAHLTAKAFAGLSFISHDVSPQDLATPVSGDDVGVKVMIELWLDMGEQAWASVDGGWAAPFNTTNVRSRVGYRVFSNVSLGLEAALNLDESAICRLPDATPGDCMVSPNVSTAKSLVTNARGGLFARYDWGTGETSLSAGALGDDGASVQSLSPYATLQWLTQF